MVIFCEDGPVADSRYTSIALSRIEGRSLEEPPVAGFASSELSSRSFNP